MKDIMRDELAAPKIVDRSTFQTELDALRVRDKALTHEGDAIAAARRRLHMVEVDPTIKLTGPHGPVTLLDAFEGRRPRIRRTAQTLQNGGTQGVHLSSQPSASLAAFA